MRTGGAKKARRGGATAGRPGCRRPSHTELDVLARCGLARAHAAEEPRRGADLPRVLEVAMAIAKQVINQRPFRDADNLGRGGDGGAVTGD